LVAPKAFEAANVTVAPAQLFAFVDVAEAVTAHIGTPEMLVDGGKTVMGFA
jgi:hypothetical protein